MSIQRVLVHFGFLGLVVLSGVMLLQAQPQQTAASPATPDASVPSVDQNATALYERRVANAANGRRPATGCDFATEQARAQVDYFSSLIERDKQAIERISSVFDISAAEMEGWQEFTQEKYDRALKEMKAAIVDLTFDVFKDKLRDVAIENTMKPTDVDPLIRKYNISNPWLQDWLRRFALISVREDPQWYNKVLTLLEALKSATELQIEGPGHVEWTDAIQVVADLAPEIYLKSTTLNRNPVLKDVGLWLSTSKAALALVIDIVSGQVSLSKIQSLTTLTEAQLKSLQPLVELLQEHVGQLKVAKANLAKIGNCDDDLAWQVSLQGQRLNAVFRVGYYYQLLQLHAAIFKHLNIASCESGFFPGGCNTPMETGQGARGPGARPSTTPLVPPAACMPPAPQNSVDALRIESASHKDVCWSYQTQVSDDGTVSRYLLATSDKPPDKNYKPQLAATTSIPNAPASTPSKPQKASSGGMSGKTILVLGGLAAAGGIAGAAAGKDSGTQTSDCTSLRNQLASELSTVIAGCSANRCPSYANLANIWSQLCSCTGTSNRAPNAAEIPVVIYDFGTGRYVNPSQTAAAACR